VGFGTVRPRVQIPGPRRNYVFEALWGGDSALADVADSSHPLTSNGDCAYSLCAQILIHVRSVLGRASRQCRL
jgi:hypothetical protein